MKHRILSFLMAVSLLGVAIGVMGCSQDQEAEKIPAEPKPSFDDQGAAGSPKAGGGGGLGNPKLNPNYKPPERRHKDLKMPKIPD